MAPVSCWKPVAADHRTRRTLPQCATKNAGAHPNFSTRKGALKTQASRLLTTLLERDSITSFKLRISVLREHGGTPPTSPTARSLKPGRAGAKEHCGSKLPAEVSFRKCAARARLQVALETNGLLLSAKLHRYNDRPRTIVECPTTRAMVVPLESFFHVFCRSDVITRRFRLAAKHVDEAPPDSLHAEE